MTSRVVFVVTHDCGRVDAVRSTRELADRRLWWPWQWPPKVSPAPALAGRQPERRALVAVPAVLAGVVQLQQAELAAPAAVLGTALDDLAARRTVDVGASDDLRVVASDVNLPLLDAPVVVV